MLEEDDYLSFKENTSEMTEVILCAISEDVCENSDGFDLLAESFH